MKKLMTKKGTPKEIYKERLSEALKSNPKLKEIARALCAPLLPSKIREDFKNAN